MMDNMAHKKSSSRFFDWSEAALFGVQLNGCGRNQLSPGHQYQHARKNTTYGLTLIREGAARVETQREKIHLAAGDLFFAPPSENWKLVADNSKKWDEYWIVFFGELLSNHHNDLPDRFSAIKKSGDTGNKLIKLCAQALKRKTPTHILAAQLVSLLAELAGQLHSKSVKPPYDPIVKIAEKIRKNPGSEINFEDSAARAGMSYSLFRKKFKLLTGTSPHQFLNNTRIELAHTMLMSGETVKEAAANVGMSDPYHFSRLFKQLKGMSPTIFRKHRLEMASRK